MAKLQDIINKRQELMATGKYANEKDAMAAARKELLSTPPVETTPTTPPTTPAPPVTPPAPTTPTELQRDQVTGLTKPIETTPAPTTPPVTTPTHTVAKTEPVDYNKSVGRESEIQKNITDITKSNPSLLKDRTAYDKAFGYATADEGKKAILDTQYQSLSSMGKNEIFQGLMSGVNIPAQNTPDYRNAKYLYDQYQKFSTMTPTQMLDNIKQGQVSTEMQGYLAQNPAYIQAKKEYDKILKANNVKSAISTLRNGMNGVEPTTPNIVDDLAAKIQKQLGYDDSMTQAFSQYVKNDPGIVNGVRKLHGINEQIADVTNLIYNGIKEIRAAKGDMPASALVTYLNSTFREANDTLVNLQNVRISYEADLKMATEMADGNFKAAMEDINNARDIQNKAIAQSMEMQNSLALSQMQFDQKIKQEAEMMQSPELAIPNVISQYASLGIMAQKSPQEHIALAKDFIARGGTLGQYISQMQKDYQAKPEYQAKFRVKLEEPVKPIIQNFGTSDKPDYRQYNQKTGQWDTISGIGQTTTPTYDGKSLFDILGKNVGTYEGNRGYDLAGNLGDPLPAGGNWTVKSVEEAGNLLGVPYVQGAKKPYGNTVVMQDENGNEIRYSHLQSISVKPGDMLSFGQQVGTRGNTGNVRGANGETLTGEQLAAGRGAHVDVEIKDKNGRLLSQDEQIKYLKGANGTTPLKKAFNSVSSGLPSASRKDATSIFDSYMSSGDTESARAFIANTYYDSLPADAKNKWDGRSTAISQLSSIQDALNEYVANGGNTNLLAGSYESFQENVLRRTGNPKLAELANQIKLGIINYRSFVSGAAFTEAEKKEYESVFPNTKNTPALNNARIKSAIDSFQQINEGLIKNRIGQDTYNQIYGTPQKQENIIYTDADGTKYTPESLKSEMEAALQSGKATPEEIRSWIIEHNLQDYYLQ